MDPVHPRIKRPYKRSGLPKGWTRLAAEAGLDPTTYFDRRLRTKEPLSHEDALTWPKYQRTVAARGRSLK